MNDEEYVEDIDTEKNATEHKGSFAQEVVKQAVEEVSHYRWWAKFLRYLFYLCVAFVVLFFVIINLPVTKNWAAEKALGFINEDFGVEISEENISLNIFGDVSIDGLEVKDHRGFPFIKIKKYHASSNWFHLLGLGKTNFLAFRSMTLRNADVKVITYKGETLDNFSLFIERFETDKPRTPNKPIFQLHTRVRVLDSKVSIINQNLDGESGKWLTADHFNVIIPYLRITGPDVTARIGNLSFYTQRHGKRHFIETFSTDFTLNRNVLSFLDLTLNTDHSLLMGDVVFNLGKKTRFSDFTNKVSLDVSLKRGSQFSGYDLSYFLNDWDSYLGIDLSGNVKGPLSGFKLKNFNIKSGEVNINTPEIQIKNLFKGNNNNGEFNIFTQNISINLTYPELRKVLSSNISKKIGNFADSLQNINFVGQADVNPHRIIASGDLLTGIGYVNLKKFNLSDFSTDKPKYNTIISTENLNLVPILNRKELEHITGDFDFEGEGFNIDSLSLNTKANLKNIKILDKNINNITIDGILNKRKYIGDLTFNDNNIQINTKGTVNFNKDKFDIDISSEINKLSLNYFGYKIQDSTEIKSLLSVKMSMSNLDDINLDASFSNLKFISPKHKFEIPKAIIGTHIKNDSRTAYIYAQNMLRGNVLGRYNLNDLVQIFNDELSGILAGHDTIKKTYENQHFNFDFTAEQNIVNILFPNINLSEVIKINGNYTGNERGLVLNASFPNLKYTTESNKEMKVDDISLKINTISQNDQILFYIRRAIYEKNIVNNLKITGKKPNNKTLLIKSFFEIANSRDEIQSQKKYYVNLEQTTLDNGDIFVKFNPSYVRSNEDIWMVDSSSKVDQKIVYRKIEKDVLVNNFRLYSGDSSILLNGKFKSVNNFETELRLSEIELAKIIKFISNENDGNISGLANGITNVKVDNENIHPIANFRIENIKINNVDVGNFSINSNISDIPNVYYINANVRSSKESSRDNLYVAGILDNNSVYKKLNFNSSLNNFDISFLEGFLDNTLSNLRGRTSGNVNILSDFKNVDYSGEVGVSDFGFKLNFTGADYSFEDSLIKVSKGLVVLDALKFNDGRNNSRGIVAGLINFENPSSVGLDLIVQAENMIILNTTYRNDFDIFWGRLTGKGDVYISGPISGLSIDANLKILSGGEFVLNTDNSSSVKEFNMLKFLKRDENSKKISLEQNITKGANMNIGLILDIDRSSSVKILLGDNIGNINIRGSADNLMFSMNRSGAMYMNGVYSIESGTYISKVILERIFQIQKGSTVSWDGNVLNPNLDIVASYNSSVSNLGEYLSVGKLQPTNVELQIKIKEKLQELRDKEAITMDIVLPNASSQIQEALQTKLNAEDEKIKQIGSILILNNFNMTSMLDGFALENAATSTGYNLIFKNLSSVLNAISSDFQIDMNYIKGNQINNTVDRANANVNVNISPRIKLRTGIGIPMFKDNDNNNIIRNDYLSGEGLVEYDLSKLNDGSTLLYFYSRPANIGIMPTSSVGQNQNYGAGVVYTKSFRNIFRSRKNKKVENSNKQQSEHNTK